MSKLTDYIKNHINWDTEGSEATIDFVSKKRDFNILIQGDSNYRNFRYEFKKLDLKKLKHIRVFRDESTQFREELGVAKIYLLIDGKEWTQLITQMRQLGLIMS